MKKKKKRPLYEMTLGDESEGVNFISVVKEPAIEINWKAFHQEVEMIVEPKAGETKEEFLTRCMSIETDKYSPDQAFAICNSKWESRFNFASINEEKRMLAGPFMVPDLKIYRRDEDGEEYDVFFSAETIETAIKRFFKSRSTVNLNEDHTDRLVPGFIMESWIVTEGVDKSQQWGFSLPSGTWFGIVHIEDEEYWNTVIKSGKVRGFSVEGFMSSQPILQNGEVKVYNPEMIDGIIDILRGIEDLENREEAARKQLAELIAEGEIVPEDFLERVMQQKQKQESMKKTKFASVELLDGTVVYTKGDVPLEVGSEVYVEIEGEETLAPDGVHETETLTITTAEGKITEILEKATVDASAEMMAAIEKLTTEMIDLATRVAALESELSMASQENQELKEELNKFGKSVPEQKTKKVVMETKKPEFYKGGGGSELLKAFEQAKAFNLY